MTNRHVEVVEQFGQALVAKDRDRIRSCIHPEAVFDEPIDLPYGGEHIGPDGFADIGSAIRESLESAVRTVSVFPAGDQVIAVMQVEYRSPPTDSKLTISVVEIYDFKDDLIFRADIHYKSPASVVALMKESREASSAGAPK